MDDLNRRAFDTMVGDYAAKTALFVPEQVILLRYADAFKGKDVVDAGCGAGRTAFYLREICGNYTGFDYSGSMIDTCRRHYPGLRFICADIRHMDFLEDNSVDTLFFSFNGLDYLDHLGRQQAVAECRRVVRPGGYFIFSSHNYYSSNRHNGPVLRFTVRPGKMIRNLAEFLRSYRNRRILGLLTMEDPDGFAVVNDNAHEFSLLTYYVSARRQCERLEQAGFEVKDILGLDGVTLSRDGRHGDHYMLYYVARKGVER